HLSRLPRRRKRKCRELFEKQGTNVGSSTVATGHSDRDPVYRSETHINHASTHQPRGLRGGLFPFSRQTGKGTGDREAQNCFFFELASADGTRVALGAKSGQ